MKKAWGRLIQKDMYNSSMDYDPPGRKRPYMFKKVIQSGVAVLFLLAILGLSGISHPLAVAARGQLAYYLTDPASDLTPAIGTFLRSGVWADTFEKGIMQVFKNLDIPVEQPVKPVTIPVSGTITRVYGWEDSGNGQRLLHPGIDIAASEPAAPVNAALDGSVRYIGKNQRLGNYVELDHGDGMVTVYGNCGEIIAVEGQEVKGGETIAHLKNDTKPYVHFEIRVNGKAVDPLNSISGGDTET